MKTLLAIIALLWLFNLPVAHAFWNNTIVSESVSIQIGEWEFTIPSFREIIFGEENLQDYQRTGSWTEDENGFQSSFGLLFIPNEFVSYRATLVAQLDYLGDEATYGGFGLLFETTLDGNNDTGFALQFDRGLIGVAIRPRINGIEQGTIALVRNADNPIIPTSRRDEFWTQEQTIILEVFEGTDTQKVINIFLNDVLIIENFVIDSSLEESFLGLRSWGRPTEFRTLLIEELESPIQEFDSSISYTEGDIIIFQGNLFVRNRTSGGPRDPNTGANNPWTRID